MGKKIKHLSKRRSQRKLKDNFKKSILGLVVVLSLIGGYNVTVHIKDMYMFKNIEGDKYAYYIQAADEAGNYEMQLNWKELLAIELVEYDGDLSKVRKKDTLELGEVFIEKDIKGNESIKTLDEVLVEMNYTEEEKNKTYKYLSDLEGVYLGGKELTKNNSKRKFIESIQEQAIANYHEYKILPSITMGQAVLESAWGKSGLTQKSNNLFGIKADNRWDGESVSIQTTENYNDEIVDEFRAYVSIEDSIEDHGKFLSENSRYSEHGLFEATHYITQAQALEDAGYSTKEDEKGEKIYADILIDVIQTYNLQLLDNKVQLKK